ncbi:MAG: hypothetical protein AB7N24_11220 [Dehalococcoidia bacterium]
MDRAQYAAARASALARMLARSDGATTDQLSTLVCGLLDAAGLTPEQRIEVLGGAFVSDAVRPYWAKDASAGDAHDALRTADAELADAVEALAQVLLGRAESREEAAEAIAELDRLYAAPAAPLNQPPSQPGLFAS